MFAQTRSLSLLAALAAISLASIAGIAEAAPQCSSHDKIVDALGNKFKETRRVMGVVNSTAVMEIFMSPQGTWTIVITDTSGLSHALPPPARSGRMSRLPSLDWTAEWHVLDQQRVAIN